MTSCFGFVPDFHCQNSQVMDIFTLSSFATLSTTDDQPYLYTPHNSYLNTSKPLGNSNFTSEFYSNTQSRLNDISYLLVPVGCFGFVSDSFSSFEITSSFVGGFMAKEVTVKILKMDHFTKRTKDLEKVHWFSFPVDLFDHPDFFELNAEELMVFIWFVCVGAKVKTDEVRMNIPHTAYKLRVSEDSINSMLEKLQGKQLDIISRPDGDNRRPHGGRTAASTEQNRTIHNRTEHNITIVPAAVEKNTNQVLNKKIWEAYRSAYSLRYQEEPKRNAKVNSLINQLGQRLGEDAVEVVSFYLSHNDSFYLKNCHSLNHCLANAESLYIQWKKGRAITNSDIRRIEKAITTSQVIEEAKKGGF